MQEVRWQNGFRDYSRAFSLLRQALESGTEERDNLEREELVQRFEYTFELALNTLKYRLEYEGLILRLETPRSVIREAVSAGLISNGQIWVDMLAVRDNLCSQHGSAAVETALYNIRETYFSAFNNFNSGIKDGVAGMGGSGLSEELAGQLCHLFAQYQDLTAVRLLGSYATGRATSRSDIDLATVGLTDGRQVGRLALDLEDLPIPQKCDIQALREPSASEPLKRHIDERGITIYQESNHGGGAMKGAYKAILHGDRVEWLDGAPEADGPVQVYVSL